MMHDAVIYALAYLGTPYVKGEFDCSRFIQIVFQEYGIARFPRYLDGQWLWSHPVNPQECAAGDLMFFCAKALWRRDFGYRWYSHAGIAISQDRVVHCSFWEEKVVVWPLEKFCERYYLTGIRRVLAEPADDFEGIESYGGRVLWESYYRRRKEAKERGENQ